jgi:hypothetical protein
MLLSSLRVKVFLSPFRGYHKATSFGRGYLLFSTVIIAFVAFSCSKDDSEGDTELFKEGGPFEFSELAGNWEATVAYFLRPSTNSGVEIVGDKGSVSLTVQSNGECTFTITPFDCEEYTESGEMFWELDNEEYYLEIVWKDSPDEGSSFRAELNDTNFSLFCGPEQCVEYDFNCDGTPDPATLSFGFTRE